MKLRVRDELVQASAFITLIVPAIIGWAWTRLEDHHDRLCKHCGWEK